MKIDYSSTCIKVTLPSGNQAIYQFNPNRLPRADLEVTKIWITKNGLQIAYEKDSHWYSSVDDTEITNPVTLTLINRM